MNPVRARQIVLASMASTVVIVVASQAVDKHKLPDTRTLAGLAFGFLFLSVAVDFVPQVAAPLSVIVMITSLVVPAPGMKKSAGEIFLGAPSLNKGAIPPNSVGGGDFTH